MLEHNLFIQLNFAEYLACVKCIGNILSTKTQQELRQKSIAPNLIKSHF